MSCCFGELVVLVESPEQVVQVGSGEAPLERHRGLLVAALEAQQPLLDLGQIVEQVPSKSSASRLRRRKDGSVRVAASSRGSLWR
jgi:regulator of sirC expression with transglutaminase-like and TPR domain